MLGVKSSRVQAWVGRLDFYMFVRFRIRRMIRGKWIIYYSLSISQRQFLIKVKWKGIFGGLLTWRRGVSAFLCRQLPRFLGLLASSFILDGPPQRLAPQPHCIQLTPYLDFDSSTAAVITDKKCFAKLAKASFSNSLILTASDTTRVATAAKIITRQSKSSIRLPLLTARYVCSYF
jgi:hypothetical protein